MAVGSVHPRRVGVWHFIVLPTITMAALVVATRYLDHLVLPDLAPATQDLYPIARTILIGLVMASLIAWLAVSYRGQYEDRLRARNEMLESTQAFLTRIIEGSAEAIVTLDPELRVTSWNAAAERIYGRGAASMIGQSVDRLAPTPEAARRERRRVHDVVRRGETLRDHESEHVRDDGERVRVRMTVSPLLDVDGSYEGSTAIIRADCATRKRVPLSLGSSAYCRSTPAGPDPRAGVPRTPWHRGARGTSSRKSMHNPD